MALAFYKTHNRLMIIIAQKNAFWQEISANISIFDMKYEFLTRHSCKFSYSGY